MSWEDTKQIQKTLFIKNSGSSNKNIWNDRGFNDSEREYCEATIQS